ncbi:MAG: helix-turn-helix domain-containing protein [Trueperaceae bacterium]|nr:helix-turn-helix domain-containing protein [Trueperaceae bacterium]
MQTRDRVLRHLKRQGATTVADVAAALALSANAARHHLMRLERHGIVTSELDRGRGGAGRPARRYALTLAAEDAFPKRYPELLAAVLASAEQQRLIDALLRGVVEALAAPLRDELAALPPRERLWRLLQAIDYGDMLPALTTDADGWQLVAHNCVYRDAGCQVAAVCELLPRVIEAATGLPAERLACQRDGRATCTFSGSFGPRRTG